MLPTLEEYEYFIFSLRERFLSVQYDPFPHPQVPELAGTHPHHKHIPPDIKHHRIPAPNISFTQPNLPFLIQEIETTLLKTQPEADE